MGSEVENAVKIAVIEEQIKGVREQNTAQAIAANLRFDSMEKKIDDLTNIMNRGKGAYAASVAFAASIGAVVMLVLSWLLPVKH